MRSKATNQIPETHHVLSSNLLLWVELAGWTSPSYTPDSAFPAHRISARHALAPHHLLLTHFAFVVTSFEALRYRKANKQGAVQAGAIIIEARPQKRREVLDIRLQCLRILFLLSQASVLVACIERPWSIGTHRETAGRQATLVALLRLDT